MKTPEEIMEILEPYREKLSDRQMEIIKKRLNRDLFVIPAIQETPSKKKFNVGKAVLVVIVTGLVVEAAIPYLKPYIQQLWQFAQ